MPPTDYPDWTTPVTQITTLGFAGLEELAARLGSIVPWDVQGNIVLMEDFESELLEWEDTSTGALCTATRSSRHKYSGDWSAALYSVGGALLEATLERWFQYPGLKKYALFARVYLDQDSQEVTFTLQFWNGTTRFTIRVYYNPKDTQLWIGSDAPGINIIDADLVLVDDYDAWFPMLVTFDLETGYYDKLYFAHMEYDISAYPLLTFETDAPPVAKIELAVESFVAGAFTVHFDDIILAKNVP